MLMGSHSGNISGADLKIGAALNGIQVRKIEPCPWDMDSSGSVNTSDLLEIFAQWGTDGTADFDENGSVNTNDLLILFANWGPCP